MATYSPYRVKSIVYKAFMGIRDKSEKANIEDPYVEMSMNLVSWKLRALGIRDGQKRLKQYAGNKKIILSLGSGGSNSLNGRLVGDEIWADVKDNTYSKKPKNIPWSDWNGGGNWVAPWSDARLAIKCSDITVPDYAERVPNAENIIVNQSNYMQCLQTDCSRLWSLMGRIDGYSQKDGAGSVVVPLGDSSSWIGLCYDSPPTPPPPPRLPPPPPPPDPDGGDIVPSPNPYRCPETLLNVTYPQDEVIYIMLDGGYTKHEQSVNFSASYMSWSRRARMWFNDGEGKITFDYDETYTGDFGCSHFHGFAGKITVEEGLSKGEYVGMLTCKVFDEVKRVKVVVVVGLKEISSSSNGLKYSQYSKIKHLSCFGFCDNCRVGQLGLFINKPFTIVNAEGDTTGNSVHSVVTFGSSIGGYFYNELNISDNLRAVLHFHGTVGKKFYMECQLSTDHVYDIEYRHMYGDYCDICGYPGDWFRGIIKGDNPTVKNMVLSGVISSGYQDVDLGNVPNIVKPPNLNPNESVSYTQKTYFMINKIWQEG